MPSKIACPHCQSVLGVPDQVRPGQVLRCLKCNQTFPMPAATPAPRTDARLTTTPVAPRARPQPIEEIPQVLPLNSERRSPVKRPAQDGKGAWGQAPKKRVGPIILLCAAAVLLVGGGILLALLLRGKPDAVAQKDGDLDEDNTPPVLNIPPLQLQSEREERPLPGTVADVVVGGGGRYLVLHLPGIQKLAIFDVSKGKIVHYVPVADDRVHIAAGLNKLFVLLGKAQVIERWDLAGKEREASAAWPFAGPARSLTLGSASTGPVLVHWARGNDELDSAPLGFLDSDTLKPLDVRITGDVRPASVRDQRVYRASSDGRVFGGWSTAFSPTGVHSLRLQGNQLTARYEHDSRGHILPSPDGSFLYTSAGVFTSDIEPVGAAGRFGLSATLPALHGDYYLRLQSNQDRIRDEQEPVRAVLHLAGEVKPLATLPPVDLGRRPETKTRSFLTPDKRLLLIPDAKVLVSIPYANNRIVLQRFDADQALEKSGIDYLVVTSGPPARVKPGTSVSHQLKVRSRQGGVKVRLETGPAGMKVTPEGKLTWSVPTDLSGEEAVVLAVGDKSGKEIFYSFKLSAGQPVQVARDRDPPRDGRRPPIDRDPEEPPFRKDKKEDPEKKDPPRPAVRNWSLPPIPPRPAIRPPALNQDKVTRALPEAIQDVVAGGGGRFLFLALPRVKQVAVFDASAGRIVKYLPVPGASFKMAAGMNKLLVAVADPSVLERWDLATFNRDLSVPLPVKGPVRSMAMGHASDGPLLLAGERQLAFVDVRTMKQMEGEGGNFHFFDLERRGGLLRASGDGRLFVAGEGVLQLGATGCTAKRLEGGGTPGPDGKHIFGGSRIVNSDGKEVHREKPDGRAGAYLVPASASPYYLKVPTGTYHPSLPGDARFMPVSVHCLGDSRPLVTLKEVNGVFRDAFANAGRLFIDQQYHFIPDANLLITIPQTADQLELHRLNLEEALEKSGVNYLFATSTPFPYAVLGKEYRYDVQVKSKKGSLKYNLESAPKGMKITAAGAFTWQTPKDFPDAEADIILTLQDGGGQEIFHVFKLHVVKALPEGVEEPGKQVVGPNPKTDPPDPEPDVKVPPAPPEHALAIKPPTLGQETVTRELAGTTNDLVVGGGGRFLVFPLPQQRKVALFDVNEARVVHYFPAAGDDVKVAAGADKLIMVFPGTRVVQRWSLLTRERELSVTVSAEKIRTVLLGSASHGPLVLCAGNRDFGAQVVFLDLDTLKPVENKAAGHRVFEANVRVSADGTVFGAWSNFSPSGLRSVVLTGNEFRSYDEHISVGHVVPGPDGKVLFTGAGLFTAEAKPLGGEGRRVPGGFTVPAAHGNYCLAIRFADDFRFREDKTPPGITVHIPGDSRALATLPLDLGKLDRTRRSEIPLDKHIQFIPAARMLVTLAQTNDRLVVRRFDVEEAVEKTGIDYLFVTSRPPHQAARGKDFVYPVVVKSKKGGVKFNLEAGPAGLAVTKTGVVVWKVPAAAEGDREVLLTIRDQAGQEIFHSFKVRVTAAAAPEKVPDKPARPIDPVKPPPDPVVPPKVDLTPLAPRVGRQVTRLAHQGVVQGVAFTPDGKKALTGSGSLFNTDQDEYRAANCVLRLWDVGAGTQLLRYPETPSPNWCLALAADAKCVASGHGDVLIHKKPFDCVVRLWDVATGKQLRVLEGHGEPIWSVAFSADGSQLLSGAGNNQGQPSDCTIRLWDVATGKELKKLQGHTNRVYAVAFLPDGRHAISGSGDRTLRLWDLQSGKEVRRLVGHKDVVRALALSPDGKRAVSGSWDATLRVWDLETGAELLSMKGKDLVEGVALSPDGKMVASGGYDHKVRLWDARSGAALGVITGHTNQVHGMAFSPDGSRLLTGSGDGSARVWDISKEGR